MAALFFAVVGACITTATSHTQKTWFHEFEDYRDNLTADGFGSQIPAESNTDKTYWIGAWMSVRGDGVQAAADGLSFGYPDQPAILRTALQAWHENKVLPPVKKAPFDIHMLFADTCIAGERFVQYYNLSKEKARQQCSPSYAARKLSTMLRGSTLNTTDKNGKGAQKHPRMSVSIGGSSWTRQLALIPGGMDMPNVGYFPYDEILSNKFDYPTYVRTNTPASEVYLAAMHLSKYLGYTRMDACWCDYPKGKENSAIMAVLGEKFGFEIAHFFIRLGQHIAQPPEEEYKKLIKRGAAAADIEEMRKLAVNMDTVAKGMLANNAHVHFTYSYGLKCAGGDMLGYSFLRGLGGKGHLYIGDDQWIVTINQNWVWATREMSHNLFEVPSAYRFQNAFEGFIYTSSVATNKTYSDELGKYFVSLKPRKKEIFGNFGQYIKDQAWDATRSDSWWTPTADFLFDATWAALLALNQVLLTKGANHQPKDIMDALKKLDFSGTTGRVRFDNATYDRIMPSQIGQYRTNMTKPLCPVPTQVPSCFTPSVVNAASVGKYTQCLEARGMDAAAAFLSAVSGGAMSSCYSLLFDPISGVTCKTNISSVATLLQAGSTLKNLCPGSCARIAKNAKPQKAKVTCDKYDFAKGAPEADQKPFYDCLQRECVDASTTMVEMLAEGQVPTCIAVMSALAAQNQGCDYDASGLLKSLPKGKQIYALCGGQCNEMCMKNRPVVEEVAPACKVPADTTPSNLKLYFGCLYKECADADGKFMSTVTGGKISTCAAALSIFKSQGKDCSADASAMLTSLPKDTFLYTICGNTCKQQCTDAKNCPAPANNTHAGLKPYFGCLINNCANANSSVVSALTGGKIPDCKAAKAFFAGQGGTCNTDGSKFLASLPKNTPLYSFCGAECKTECTDGKNACPAPANNTHAGLQPYFVCLTDKCQNAAKSVVSTLTGGKIPDCKAAKGFFTAQGGSCSTDGSTFLASLPKNTPLYSFCGAECKTECTVAKNTCPAPADNTHAGLKPYFVCLTDKCQNAATSIVSTLTGGKIPDCKAAKGFFTAQGGSCNTDGSTFLASLPKNTPLYSFCGAECNTECTVAKNTCPAPANNTHAGLKPYFVCLTAKCQDAAKSVVSTLTGGKIPDCKAAKGFFVAQGGSCNTDASTFLASLPKNTPLYSFCGAECKTECADAKNACPSPANNTHAGLKPYFTCLTDKCADAAKSVVSTLTGGKIGDCKAAKAFFAAQGGSCHTDGSTFLASLPKNTPLYSFCGAECKTECTVAKNTCPVPSSFTHAGLAPYFVCLTGKCQDAAKSVVSTLTGGKIPDCKAAKGFFAAQGGSCNTDGSKFLASLPKNTPLYSFCGAECKTECGVSKTVVCRPPEGTPTAASIATYAKCLKFNCVDAESAFIKTMTGGKLGGCKDAFSFVNNKCETDLSGMLTALPKGTKLQDICGNITECKTACVDANNTCSAPSVPLTAAALGEHLACTKTKCRDADDAAVKSVTGGKLGSCTQVVGFLAAQGKDCNYDTSLSLPSLPPKTYLYGLCGKQCKQVCTESKNLCTEPVDTKNQSLTAYLECLQSKCQDAADSVVTQLKGSASDCKTLIQTAGLSCTSDVSAQLTNVSTGHLLHHVCRKQCASFCAPSVDIPKAVKTYSQCLKKSCGNAEPSFLKNLTGEDYNCTTLKKLMKGNCSADLSAIFPRVAEGSTLMSICQAECDCFFFWPPYKEFALGVYERDSGLKLGGTGRRLAGFSPIVYFEGSTEKPTNLNKQCGLGKRYNTTTAQCLACPAGSYAGKKGQSACALCQAGMHSANEGSSRCETCKEGTYSSMEGWSKCNNCSRGTFADEVQKTACQNCAMGFTSEVAGKICDRCPHGKYADKPGSSKCTVCPHGTRTKESGSSSVSDCLCNVSTFKPPRGFPCDECEPGMVTDANIGATSKEQCFCPPNTVEAVKDQCFACDTGKLEGLKCPPGGANALIVKEGYYANFRGTLPREAFAGVVGNYSIFKCFDILFCPEGPVGGCSFGRTGLGCGQCVELFVVGDNGECEMCGGPDSFPLICGALGLFCALCAIYNGVENQNPAKQPQSMLLLGIVGGMCVTIVQQMGVFSTMSIPWPDPMKSMLNVMNVLQFDVEVLKIGCVGQMQALWRYGVRLGVIVVASAGIVFIHICFVIGRHKCQFKEKSSTLIGAMGTIMMVALISIVNTTILPLQCVPHPNGLTTVRSYPQVVCFEEGEHTAMTILGFGFMLIPLGFVSGCCMVARRFPKRMAAMDTKFLHCYAFLFFRFKPDAYWYTIFLVVRNLFIALTPTLPNTWVLFQIVIMVSLLLITLVLSAFFTPWRHPKANYLDAILTGHTVLFMSCAGFFIDDADVSIVAIVCTFVMSLNFVAIFILVAITVRPYVMPMGKNYAYFICHHKGGAGAFARLVKTALLEEPEMQNKSVWLDCDDLKNLETIFDYVGAQSECVIVLQSKELNSQPYCMGQLVTAHLKEEEVEVMCVVFPDYLPPTDEFIDTYGNNMDLSSLGTFGIKIPMIKEMLRWLKGFPGIRLSESIEQSVINQLVDSILTNEPPDHVLTAKAVKSDVLEASKMICIADVLNMESVATGLVLCNYLAKFCAVGTGDTTMLPHMFQKSTGIPQQTAYSIFVLSNGCFKSSPFLFAMYQAAKLETRFMPVIAEDGFRFPSRVTYDEFKAELPRVIMELGIPVDAGILINLIHDIVKEIGVVFEPQDYSSSHMILNVKAKDIAQRLLGNQSVNPLLMRSGRLGNQKETDVIAERGAPMASDPAGIFAGGTIDNDDPDSFDVAADDAAKPTLIQTPRELSLHPVSCDWFSRAYVSTPRGSEAAASPRTPNGGTPRTDPERQGLIQD